MFKCIPPTSFCKWFVPHSKVPDVSSRRHPLILMRTALQDFLLLLQMFVKRLEFAKKRTLITWNRHCPRYIWALTVTVASMKRSFLISSIYFNFHQNFWFLTPYYCTKFASLCVLHLTLQFGWWIWKHTVYCDITFCSQL